MILLSDYGGVICFHQPEEDVAKMASVAAMSMEEFVDAYWRRRMEYDRGDLLPGAYWSDVLGRPIVDDRLATMRRLDVQSWLHPNPDTLEAFRALTDRYQLALLSNAPEDLALALRTVDWLPTIEPRFFSYAFRLVKPDPRIYDAVLTSLDVDPHEVVFVDDRIDNVRAAEDAGMRGIHFENPSDLDVLGSGSASAAVP
ncbi:MAG TPA: HAD-IA family hydrolase [Chloroflexota bacterium]|nr:HAD-IA family hydrolase [Chloroflexota bacterium]